MTDVVEVSDSQIKSFVACQRCWGYKKILKLDPAEDKDNLILGDALHCGTEAFVLKRDLAAAQTLCVNKIMAGKPNNQQWQAHVVPQMLVGWATLWLPRFEQKYEIVQAEQPFSYYPHPTVHYRGKKDIRCRNRQTGKFSVWDYKTTGQAGGGELSKELHINRQLAIYATDERRTAGAWPEEVGLIFFQKPKKTLSLLEAMNAARTDPTLYHEHAVQVTPRFAQFALDVEASDVLVAQQMQQYRELHKQIGLKAFEFIPANFTNCYSYGRECGFAAGCHSGNPVHRTLKR